MAMNQVHKSILPDHEEQFAEVFEQITESINNDQLAEAAKKLISLHHADLADFLDNTNYKIHKKVLPLIAGSFKPETLVWLSNSAKQSVIEALGERQSAELIEQLDTEDSIEVIEDIGEDTKETILSYLSTNKKQQIIEGFNYPDNTVGRVIEKNFVALQANWTVGEAIDFIRQDSSGRDFHAAIIVDSRYRPIGNILLSGLLKSAKTSKIKEVMNPDLKIADALTELSELVFIFKQYALTIVPVINKSGKLIGIVSIDNMLYIIEQQTEKDIMQLAGVHSQDTLDNFFYTAKHRFPWLFVNLITTCGTSLIISQFSGTIAKLITLAPIMPIVASMCGNAGTQAMTITVRAIANKDINQANMFKVIIKEIAVCGFNGFLLACIGGLMLALIVEPSVSLIFASAVIINFIVAGFFGSVIPITLHNFDIDPATASGVFLTSITDAFGFFTFLTLAYKFLV